MIIVVEQADDPVVRIQPAVTEDWIRDVVQKGASPTEFAEWALSHIDLEARLEEYMRRSPNQDRTVPTDQSREPSDQRDAQKIQTRERVSKAQEEEAWTRDLFFDFLEVASSIPDLEWSMALLHAYLELGPMPSSEDLQRLCGFESQYVWRQELRIAKQKLTLHARKMDAPPLFPRAKTATDDRRLHPIEPRLFPWLREWFADRTTGEQPVEGSGLPDPEHWGQEIEASDKYEAAKT